VPAEFNGHGRAAVDRGCTDPEGGFVTSIQNPLCRRSGLFASRVADPGVCRFRAPGGADCFILAGFDFD